jgi:dihydroneopterin aldolase
MMTFTLTGNCVYLEKIEVLMIIGAFRAELEQYQRIEVSVALELSLLDKLDEDDLNLSYDYTQVHDIVKRLALEPYVLVEYFARNIAEHILKTSKNIKAVEVIIGKKGAFVDIERVGCRICCRGD